MLSRMLTIREQLLLGGFGLAVAMGAITMVWYHNWGPGAREAGEWVSLEPDAETVAEVDTAGAGAGSNLDIVLPEPKTESEYVIAPMPKISVTVRGAVVHEGVFRFAPDSRIHDALEEAGGALDSADLSDINLSAKLADATTLIIPYDPYGPGPSRKSRFGPLPSAMLNPSVYTLSGQGVSFSTGGDSAAAGASSGKLININTATGSALETLPGIGPSLSQRIIAYREQGAFKTIEELMEVPGIGDGRFNTVRELVTAQ